VESDSDYDSSEEDAFFAKLNSTIAASTAATAYATLAPGLR
jgi:hypothetical protein